MFESEPLPEPDSPELEQLGLGASARAIYRVLYETRDSPLTELEIEARLRGELGDQSQFGRRRRYLNPHFLIEHVRQGREYRYRLVSRKPPTESGALNISERIRAQVLQFGRCEQCGRTPRDHGVLLQVDHKMPQAWGGTNALSNLQALCDECNRGKKDYYETLDRWGPAIREAGALLEPHHRIARMLKLAHPEEIRTDVLEVVAHQQQYQDDWHKRTRELRELGWDYKWRREQDQTGRSRSYYRLTRVGRTPPDGLWASEIRKAEQAKKAAKARGEIALCGGGAVLAVKHRTVLTARLPRPGFGWSRGKKYGSYEGTLLPQFGERELPSGVAIRAAAPLHLVAMKIEAFDGRGRGDYLLVLALLDLVLLSQSCDVSVGSSRGCLADRRFASLR